MYPKLAAHVGEYLATTLFGSSALAIGCEALRKARQTFGQNEDMCALTEQVIFTEPCAKADNNHWTSPQLDDAAAALRTDSELKSAICSLKRRFACDGAALLHGDLHTGSIMCTESTTFVIDHEFAFYGPRVRHRRAFLANLFLAYFAQDGYEGDRSSQRSGSWRASRKPGPRLSAGLYSCGTSGACRRATRVSPRRRFTTRVPAPRATRRRRAEGAPGGVHAGGADGLVRIRGG